MSFGNRKANAYSLDLFATILAEETVSGWFERYDFPKEHFEVTMVQILEKTENVLMIAEKGDYTVVGADPYEMGREIAEGGMLERAHAKHPEMGPITVDEMVNDGGHIILSAITTVIMLLEHQKAGQ